VYIRKTDLEVKKRQIWPDDLGIRDGKAYVEGLHPCDGMEEDEVKREEHRKGPST
jgi:hypothetical protein